MSVINEKLHTMAKVDGMVPTMINARSGEFRYSSTISVGASADSYYEYLIKQWLQTGKTEHV